MKITGIRTRMFEHGISRKLGDANNPDGRQRYAGLAVYLDTDEGVTGVALGGAGQTGALENMVERVLKGRDPRGVVGLWQRMVDLVFKGGNRGTVTDVIGTLDVALWDLKAKINNEPLWKTLGGSSRYVKAYASDIGTPLSDDELRAFYEAQAARGIAIGKLKVGLDRETDLRRIGIMRDALATSGKDPVILIDSNEYWSPKQAIQNIRYFEQHYDIYWAEEPARRWDYDGLKKVSQSVKAAVATGENLDQPADFRPLIQMRAADVLQVGRNTSGFTGAMRVAAMCDGFDIPVALMSSPGFYQAHIGTVMPNHIWMEVVDAGRDLVFDSDAHIEDGWIVLGDRPGHGLVFDDAQLDKYAITQRSAEAAPSPWGRRRGAAAYPVPNGEPWEIGQE